MNHEETKQKLIDFEKQYGTMTAIKANLKAINRMLIKRGKEQELFDNIENVLSEFEKKGK